MHRKRTVSIAAALSLSAVACSNKSTVPLAPPAASVVSVARGGATSTLTIAGQFEPYQQVDLHAKVSGYIRWIKVDIGDRVHKGQVLADLEVPELQDQLQGTQAQVRYTQSQIVRAQSEVASGMANYSALHTEFTRLEQASKQRPGLIAEQELDDARAKDQQAAAQVNVAKAALEAMQQQLGVSQADSHRVQTLANYEQIISPFNGVVTMRYADTGSLIQAGTSSNTQSMPVVQVAQCDLLRLRMPVPESDVPFIAIGSPVQIKVNATGRSFSGKIVRFARSLDGSTRTMLTEVDVPNPDLTLNPGMFADATIQLQQKPNALLLPAQAILHNGNQSYVLALDGSNHVQRRDVTLGIETADKAEIASGLREGDRVIASGQSGYQVGETVTPHAAFIPTPAEETSE